jgi:alpha-glucosidase
MFEYDKLITDILLRYLRFKLLTGKAEGFLFEDDGDGYEFTKGNYLLTHYVAELQSSIVTVSVHKTEGSWKRPKRRLHIQVLLGGGAKVCYFS